MHTCNVREVRNKQMTVFLKLRGTHLAQLNLLAVKMGKLDAVEYMSVVPETQSFHLMDDHSSSSATG